MRYFGSSGIRGLFPGQVSPDLMRRVCGALVRHIPHGRFVMGRDGRTTSHLLSLAVSSSLQAQGARVSDCGLVATPTLAFAARGFDAGIMVTASHNPPEYNGVKLWNPDGSGFDTAAMTAMESLMDTDPGSPPGYEGIGDASAHPDAVRDHMDVIMKNVSLEDDVYGVVDCGNGVGATITPHLLREMGADLIDMNTRIDGRFPGRSPEPLPETLGALTRCVRGSRAAFGIAHDGDADRMVVVDENGVVVSLDRIIALFASEMQARSIVVPVDCSMCVDHHLEGARVLRTRVGDVFISEMMRRSDAGFGGEPSGTFVFPRVSYAPDGVHASALLARIVSGCGGLSRAIDGIPEYPTLRKSIPYTGERAGIEQAIETRVKGTSCERVDTLDGYRMEFDIGWCLVRFSGTEPKVRILAEGVDARSAERLLDLAERLVTESIAEADG